MEDQVQLVDMDSWYLILASALLVVAAISSAAIVILLLMYLPSWGNRNDETITYRERGDSSAFPEQDDVELLSVKPVYKETPPTKRRGRPPKKHQHNHQGRRTSKVVSNYTNRAKRATSTVLRSTTNADLDEDFYRELDVKGDEKR